jgi:3-isopropylmalate/(R)-2-methylmalate dehydratase large subunit
VAPDDATFDYVSGREFAPAGADWDRALEGWKRLPSDPEAHYDKSVTLDVRSLAPMISFGTNPSMCVMIDQAVPDPASIADSALRAQLEGALEYMGLRPGERLLGRSVDVVFIGSCTNSRISDLRAAASIFRGRKVSPGTTVLIVPGSEQVRSEARDEGLDRVFREAGAEWREPGCSMCIAMNGDRLQAGQVSVSTSNRNFEGRQGPGGRTMLASPLTAAAAAVTGRITDPRELLD